MANFGVYIYLKTKKIAENKIKFGPPIKVRIQNV